MFIEIAMFFPFLYRIPCTVESAGLWDYLTGLLGEDRYCESITPKLWVIRYADDNQLCAYLEITIIE